jgi:DNA modification methylase
VKITKLADLKLDTKNANKGTERGRKMLKASLDELGAGRSILVDRNGSVIAGNMTLETARELKRSKVRIVQTSGDELVVVQRTDLDIDSKKARKLAIADNRVAEVDLEWNPEALASLDLDLGEFFNDAELRKLLGSQPGDEGPQPQLDRVAELQKKWKAERGQIWEIGKHRLICGDATNFKEVSLLMKGTKAEMCCTDPPWNVAIGGDNNPRHRQREGLTNDSMPQKDFVSFLAAAAQTIAQFTGGDVYCVMGCEQWPTIDAALRAVDLHWSATIIWVKDLFVLGRSKYHRRYEPIWYGWPKARNSSFDGGRDLDDVWEIARPRTSEEHPTMKPVELYRRAIANSSGHKALVFDPFAGSGTIFVAAEQTGRVANGCEIAPRYVAVALEGMSDMGVKPKLVKKG